jgi:hypothetical protein
MRHGCCPKGARALFLTLACCLAVPAAGAQEDGSKVYQDTLKSVAWIFSPRGKSAATGTGSLVDLKQRLVLTNYHVVGDVKQAVVLFPAYRDGKVIAERDYYRERLKSQGIRAKVIDLDKKHDLALLQLERVPDGARALALAPSGAMPGQNVHSIGNPGGSGALWVYTPGKVRQVYHHRWKAKVGDEVKPFNSDVVETDSATNPGDSGGPLVNDRGLLVGVTHGGATNARLLSTFIDVGEVRPFLAANGVKTARAARPVREKPIKDGAKFFSEEAVKKATEDVRALAKKYGKDLVIETFAQVPEDDLEKVKAMTREQRSDYFRDWARKRVKDEKVEGVYVLICKNPSHLYVEVTTRSRKLFDNATTRKLIDLLLAKFREKKYDEGLSAAVRFVAERLEAAKNDP